MNLPVNANHLTMNSVEFLEKVINPCRVAQGQGEIRYNDFIARVKDELDTTHDEIFAMESTGGRTRQAVNLDYDQMMLVGMRESKAVRKSVLSAIKHMVKPEQPQLPQTFAEALQLAADQAKQLELQAPKVAFVDNLVDRTGLMNATQVGQPHGLSAVKLNKMLDEFNVYNKAVKRGRVFQQWFIDKGYGEMKQTDAGFPQALFTNAGAVWINEKLISEGVV